MRYYRRPSKGSHRTPQAANAELSDRLDGGMTLVVSYWSGESANQMQWLDGACRPDEISGWGCSDAFSEHPDWSWRCDAGDTERPHCSAYVISNVRLDDVPPPTPPPPPSPPRHTWSPRPPPATPPPPASPYVAFGRLDWIERYCIRTAALQLVLACLCLTPLSDASV